MLSYLGGATQEVCQLSKEEVEDANSNYKWVLHEGLEMMVGNLEEVEDANSNSEWVLHEGLEMMVGNLEDEMKFIGSYTKISIGFLFFFLSFFERKRSRGRIFLSFYLFQRSKHLILI